MSRKAHMTDRIWGILGRLRRPIRLHSDESGQGLVEYALIIALVSLGAIGALSFVKGSITGLFSEAGSNLGTVAVGGGAGGGGTTGPTPGTVAITQPTAGDGRSMVATNSGWTGVGTGNSYSYVWQQADVADTHVSDCGTATTWVGTWPGFTGGTFADDATNQQTAQDIGGNADSGDRCYRVIVTATGPGGTSAPLTSAGKFVDNF
jgi:pilus assembly protein Flp/PilA